MQSLPPNQREDAVSSLEYEARARVEDPVYGCVGIICILQVPYPSPSRAVLPLYLQPQILRDEWNPPASPGAEYLPIQELHFHDCVLVSVGGGCGSACNPPNLFTPLFLSSVLSSSPECALLWHVPCLVVHVLFLHPLSRRGKWHPCKLNWLRAKGSSSSSSRCEA